MELGRARLDLAQANSEARSRGSRFRASPPNAALPGRASIAASANANAKPRVTVPGSATKEEANQSRAFSSKLRQVVLRGPVTLSGRPEAGPIRIFIRYKTPQ